MRHSSIRQWELTLSFLGRRYNALRQHTQSVQDNLLYAFSFRIKKRCWCYIAPTPSFQLSTVLTGEDKNITSSFSGPVASIPGRGSMIWHTVATRIGSPSPSAIMLPASTNSKGVNFFTNRYEAFGKKTEPEILYSFRSSSSGSPSPWIIPRFCNNDFTIVIAILQERGSSCVPASTPSTDTVF